MTKKLIREAIHFPAADGVRGLACLIVLVAHAVTMFFQKTAPHLAGTGKIGVWLFFVLSAFLLTQRILTYGFNIYSITSYAIGRFFRIIPIFIIALVFYRVFGTAGLQSWADVGNALFFQEGFAHLWTVPVEFSFYFFLPALVYAFTISKNLNTYAFYIISLVLVILQQALWPYSSIAINSINTIHYFPTFLVGIVLAFSPWTNLKIKPSTEIIILIFMVVIITLSTPGARFFIFSTPFDFRLSNWFVYFGIFWAFFIAIALMEKGIISRYLSHPFIRLIGAWSFPIYLFHWFFYIKLAEQWPQNLTAMLTALILAIIFGGVVHYLIETPIEIYRKNVQNKLLALLSRTQES